MRCGGGGGSAARKHNGQAKWRDTFNNVCPARPPLCHGAEQSSAAVSLGGGCCGARVVDLWQTSQASSASKRCLLEKVATTKIDLRSAYAEDNWRRLHGNMRAYTCGSSWRARLNGAPSPSIGRRRTMCAFAGCNLQLGRRHRDHSHWVRLGFVCCASGRPIVLTVSGLSSGKRRSSDSSRRRRRRRSAAR